MVYKLSIEHDAQNDLALMVEQGGQSRKFAAILLAFLQQLKADQSLLGELLTHEYENKSFNVSRFQSIWRDRDVWRLKTFEWDISQTNKTVIPYRIIYAYDSKCTAFRVLAIVYRRHNDPRSYDYEHDHPITQRILKAYNELGLPVFKSHYVGKYKH
ncbi:hypothetical protein FGKAn22_08880 [Ferrigenium kumadai]|uniref:Uncharacterized protein n=1 Tax=Ferrigenium kumadai TaxID=1682490 RepID=A0AAN1SZT7_9PROT|nr:hypothetical protein FGKAn22_08880 [Ferrigenium kumadai]